MITGKIYVIECQHPFLKYNNYNVKKLITSYFFLEMYIFELFPFYIFHRSFYGKLLYQSMITLK